MMKKLFQIPRLKILTKKPIRPKERSARKSAVKERELQIAEKQ
jgi:hypothetical protein